MPVQKANGHSLWPQWSCISLLSFPHQVWKVPSTRQNSSPPSLPASRFLGTGLTSSFLPYQSWSSQAPRLWWHHHKTGRCGRTKSTVYKIKQLGDLSGTWTTVAAGQQNPWSPNGQGYFHHHLLPPSSECVINIFPHFYFILILLYWYHKVLRFDPFCRASRWLGTVSQPVIQIFC